MDLALEEARRSLKSGVMPIGAVLVVGEETIARAAVYVRRPGGLVVPAGTVAAIGQGFSTSNNQGHLEAR
jgi:threonine aldolase